MGLLDKLGSDVMAEASKNIGAIFSDLGTAIAQFVNTPEDKIKVQALIQDGQQKTLAETNRHSEAVLQEATKQQLSEDQNVTDRQKTDMTSDSWLSKNIRPLTLAYMLLLLTTVFIVSFCGIKMDASLVELLKILLVTSFVFYFGGRSYEKSTAIKNQ